MSVVYSSSYEAQINKLRELLGVDSYNWDIILDAAIQQIDADVHPRTWTENGRTLMAESIAEAFRR